MTDDDQQNPASKAIPPLMNILDHYADTPVAATDAPDLTPEQLEMLRRVQETPIIDMIAKVDQRRKSVNEGFSVDQPATGAPIHRVVAAVVRFFEEISLGEASCPILVFALDRAGGPQSDNERELVIGDEISSERGMAWLGNRLSLSRAAAPGNSGTLFSVEVDTRTGTVPHAVSLKVSLKWPGGSADVVLTAAAPSQIFSGTCPCHDWHDLRLAVEPV